MLRSLTGSGELGPSPLLRRCALSALILGVSARLLLVWRDLPYYQVDENDIVEQAYVFLSGDGCPRFFSYGPLVSYVLAGLYALAGSVLGTQRSDLLYDALFEPTPFYATARVLHAVADVAAVAVAAGLAGRSGGAAARWAVLSLGAAPLLSLNSDFAIRNDTFLGLFTLLAVGLAGRPRSALLTGAAAGCALAVKPLQALLVMPALVVGVAWASRSVPGSRGTGAVGTSLRAVGALLVAVVVTHGVLNPCSVSSFGELWRDNAFWVGNESPFAEPGWRFAWWLQLAGLPLTVFGGLSIVLGAAVTRDRTTRLALLYVMTVVGVYLLVGVRPYWYNAVLPSLLLPAGALAVRIAASLPRARGRRTADVAVVLGLLLTAWPLAAATRAAWQAWLPSPSLERRADRAAQLWIEERLPTGSHLLVVGRYAQGMPRLVAETPKVHGEWADLYMYGRGSSREWMDAFKTAYRRHRHGGAPLYWITNVRREYTDQWSEPVVSERMHDALPDLARQAGARYVVTGSTTRFTGRWEKGPEVRLLATFTPERGSHLDAEIKVFELLPERSGS
jgi:hypothetical protein